VQALIKLLTMLSSLAVIWNSKQMYRVPSPDVYGTGTSLFTLVKEYRKL